eukprot:scaffold6790_cov99-Isochrysis_galbana.AAC.6
MGGVLIAGIEFFMMAFRVGDQSEGAALCADLFDAHMERNGECAWSGAFASHPFTRAMAAAAPSDHDAAPPSPEGTVVGRPRRRALAARPAWFVRFPDWLPAAGAFRTPAGLYPATVCQIQSGTCGAPWAPVEVTASIVASVVTRRRSAIV